MNRKNAVILLSSLSAAWICFIFGNSLMPASVSGEASGGALEALNRLLAYLPGSPELTEHFVRKAAHFIEFAVLGFLLTLLAHNIRRKFKYAIPCAIAPAVACVDEIIQLFVDGRSGQIGDVAIDIAGAAAGGASVLALTMIVFICKNHNKTAPHNNKY